MRDQQVGGDDGIAPKFQPRLTQRAFGRLKRNAPLGMEDAILNEELLFGMREARDCKSGRVGELAISQRDQGNLFRD